MLRIVDNSLLESLTSADELEKIMVKGVILFKGLGNSECKDFKDSHN